MNYQFKSVIYLVLLCLNVSAKKPVVDWRAALVSDTLDVLMDGKQVGSIRNSYTFNEAGVESRVLLTVENAGVVMMDVIERRMYDSEGNIVSAFQQIKSTSGTTSWELTIQSGTWNCTVVTAGVRTARVVKPVKENLISTYSMYNKLKSKTLKTGDSWVDTILELTSGEGVVNTTTCVESPSEQNGNVWVLTTRNSLQEKDERWELDGSGKTVYHEISPFIASKRGVKRASKQTVKSTDSDLFETFTVRVSKAPAPADRISLILDSSVTLDQSVASMYKMEHQKYTFIPPVCVCSAGPAGIADSMKEFLVSTATLQVDHPEIIALEKQLHDDKIDVCKRIQKYTSYVYKTLKKQNTATFSSAVETLRAGFGDCGEHAVLLAALLRASGTPARVVMGLVYLDSRKGYLGHAWVMAHTGKEWVFTDPALGTSNTCNDRIPLLIDDSGQKMVRMVGMIGKIKIEIENQIMQHDTPKNNSGY